jgi:hypothetical protein
MNIANALPKMADMENGKVTAVIFCLCNTKTATVVMTAKANSVCTY